MLPSFLACAFVFGLVTLGLAWPVVARCGCSAAERVAASAALSLVGVFCAGWAVYLFALPAQWFWVLPVAAVMGLLMRWPELRATSRDPAVRSLLVAQALVTAWCVGWLATIESYSGGGWAGDWYEHWERARFFLDRGTLDTKFIGQYALTARPPLANVVMGVFLALSQVDFAHYQLLSTLFASLAFFPAALLAIHFSSAVSRDVSPRAVIALLTVLAMANPLLVQNATFPWTKLPTTFFVLTALHFFLRARAEPGAIESAALCALCLAAGMLAHYSAGPYCVVLALAWLAAGWRSQRSSGWWRATLVMAATGGVVLALWLGWAVATYGVRATFLSNTSITSAEAHQGSQFVKVMLNLFDTVVPHFLRPFDPSLIAQSSAWGSVRDWFFQCYQLNLLLAFGSVTWVAILRLVWTKTRPAPGEGRLFWGWFITGVVFLGVATHGQRDHWGLAHICLQALIVLGLALLAAHWRSLERSWRRVVVAGVTLDFVAGIVLHFAVQSFTLERWLAPDRTFDQVFATLSEPAQMNALARITHRLTFFGDALAVPLWVVPGLLALIAAVALANARSARTNLERS